MKNKILIASDHAGRKVKLQVMKVLKEFKIDFYDCSPKNTKTDDYPDFAKIVGEEVSSAPNRIGILVCGTGIGISIAANKIKGVRAALISEKKDAELSRKHNDANILALKGWKKHSMKELTSIIKTFYNTKFEGGRHQKRVDKIKLLE